MVTMGKITLEMLHRTRDMLIRTTGAFTIIDGLETIYPYQTLSQVNFSHIKSDDLADHTYNVSGPIDAIIRVNVLSRHLGPRMHLAPFELMTQETSFGWIGFGGRAPDVPIKSTEEIDCENLYESTLERKEGRYSVTLLIKPNAELGESRERGFQRDPELREKNI